jgi:hypothetical protein
MKPEKIILKSNDLPIPLEVIGENGEREIYIIKPAGRKFGASLSKPEKPVT